MKSLHIILCWSLLTLLALLIAGCGTTTGGSGSGIGADAPPWPNGPSRTAPANGKTGEQVPDVALAVLLRGKAAENEVLYLDINQVELKYGDQWVPVASREAMAKIESLPLTIGHKGTTAMLATQKTKVPKQKYTHLRLRFDDKKTALEREKKKHPLTLQATLELGEWTPDEKAVNQLIVNLDGTKVSVTGNSATLPAEALLVAKGLATAGVSGKIVPPAPTARVEAYWSNTKVMIGSAVPAAQDGTFQITNLPSGSYRLEIVNPGYTQPDEDKKPLVLEDKVVQLGDVKLVKDVETK